MPYLLAAPGVGTKAQVPTRLGVLGYTRTKPTHPPASQSRRHQREPAEVCAHVHKERLLHNQCLVPLLALAPARLPASISVSVGRVTASSSARAAVSEHTVQDLQAKFVKYAKRDTRGMILAC